LDSKTLLAVNAGMPRSQPKSMPSGTDSDFPPAAAGETRRTHPDPQCNPSTTAATA